MVKTTNPSLVPIHITVIGLMCSSCWFLYGFLKDPVDWNVVIPNALGKFYS